MDVIAVLRAVMAGIVLAYVPGFAWTWALLPGLAGLARHVVAVGLSVAIVALALWTGNAVLSLPIGGDTAFFLSIALAAAGAGVGWLRRRVRSHPVSAP